MLGYQGTLGLDRILRAMCYEFSDDSGLKVFMLSCERYLPVTAHTEHRHWTFNWIVFLTYDSTSYEDLAASLRKLQENKVGSKRNLESGNL